MSSRQSKTPSANRRTTKACARCRKRKIKCDIRFPVCGSCAAAHVDCIGYDAAHGVERPRSAISHLEAQVAKLKIELAQIKAEQSVSPLDENASSIEKLCLRLAEGIAEPNDQWHGFRDEENRLSLSSSIFVSSSPLPLFHHRNADSEKSSNNHDMPQHANIKAVPRHVIDVMLKNYCERYLPQYPCLEESEVYAACERVYNDEDPSHYDSFCIAITLAISATTLMRFDEKRATTTAEEFWAAANQHLQYVGRQHPWQRLQALQLMAHYASLNPKLLNNLSCANAASRLCIQLGLHNELPSSDAVTVDSTVLNTRRRLFWTSYIMESAFSTVLCRPSLWPRSAVTAKFPDFAALPTSTTYKVWTWRQIEVKITATMYYPWLNHDESVSNADFPSWFAAIQNQINDWYSDIKSPQNVENADRIEFHEVFYLGQILRLNRPSPRCPFPTFDMRQAALKSAVKLIKEYAMIQRQGKFFYIWNGIHGLTEYGLTALETVLWGLEEQQQDPTNLFEFDLSDLLRTIRMVPMLLRRASSRWPALLEQAEALEDLFFPVINLLDQSIRNKSTTFHDPIIRQTREKILQTMLPTTTPTVELPGTATSRAMSYDELLGSAQHSGPILMNPVASSVQVMHHSGAVAMPSTQEYVPGLTELQQAQVIDPLGQTSPPRLGETLWPIGDSNLDWTIPPYPEQYWEHPHVYSDTSSVPPLNDDEVYFWDIAGLSSDDIFAALMEGSGFGHDDS